MSDAASDQNPSNLIPLTTGADRPRELPSNLQAEQNFLGALLLDNDILDRVNVQLRPEHFYDPLHMQIFEAATRLIGRAQLANPVTLKTFFHDHAGFDDDGPASYLGDLVDGVISISEAKDYADIIHQAYLRRELVRISDNVIHDAQNPDIEIPAQTQIEAAEQHLFNLAEDDTAEQGLKSFDLVLSETISIAETATKTEGHLSGVSTGLTGLNNLLGGLHKSDLLVLAGRPAMGKTALATNIAFHAATTTRTDETAVPVAFFSLEMSAEQLGIRILAERSGLDSENIRRGRMNDREFLSLVEASEQIAKAPFYIDDTPALSVSQMASRARRLKRTKGLGLIVVDYLQLLQAQIGSRPENRVQEISNISRSLKSLAKELDVPVLALSQLSRAVEQREDKHPNLADLRESGSIEQDADVVMFVYREEYYLNKGEPEQKENETQEKYNLRYQLWQERLERATGKAEVIIAKQRHGPVGVANVGFDGRLTKFADLVDADQLPDSF
ncbi:MAG: replicative DNA helicase [SAR116 cluster bacterium]|nr:replicative DNA helicase [SAR116 cluster bacterium]